MKKTSEARKKANRKYDFNNTVLIPPLKLNIKTDADIIEHLNNQENRQGYLKRIIREDMKKESR